MALELEKPRVTEIQVRMDCNGCVQKIKKALLGVEGIYDLSIDFPQQKLTVIGRADPGKILKAIKKTRKIATICSHYEPADPDAQPSAQAPEGGPPAPETANPPPPAEAPQGQAAPQAEAAPPAEPPMDQPPPPENPPTEATPATGSGNANATQPGYPPGPNDVGKVHVIYHHPPDYGYGYGYGHNYGGHERWSRYPNVQSFPHEPPKPIYIRQHEPPNGQSFPQQPPQTVYVRQQEPPNVQSFPHQPPQTVYVRQHEPRQHEPIQHVQQNGQSSSQQPPQTVYVRQHEPPNGQSSSHEPSQPIHVRPHETPNGQCSLHEPPQPIYVRQHEPPQPIYVRQNEPPQPIYMTHSYNRYRPSPYVTEYQCVHSPPPYPHYSRMDPYSEEYHSNGNGNGNITSIFSDENPNACRIM
ncbi:hypothetical protein SLEP1_g40104 [Rubroshorea leprosula]|uniref:HMA domain-containing protein n=1 Tax=Rubroshorea leprosula TaxID=152421 RepID=A0AAV5L2S6_9ROSI|nr:hypothetical protein SLEP1_g40104 [Rubroshorea leprosula]